MNAKVSDVMTTRVVAVGKDASFKDIAGKLRQHRVSAFPVVDDDGRVIGIVSEADMLPKEAMAAGSGSGGALPGMLHRREAAKAGGITAAELMTKPPVTITADEPVTSAARLMYHCRVKRLPVVTQDGHLAGIISRADVLSVYSRPDSEIAREITQNVILNGFLADPGQFTVTVKDGIVTLEGHPDTAEKGRDIVAEVWHVQGVVSVRDRFSYPPPSDRGPQSMGPLF